MAFTPFTVTPEAVNSGSSLKIAFLYAYSPSGHSSAAAALQEAWRHIDPSVRTFSLDLTADLHPFLGPMISKAYFELVQKTPKLWDYVYDNHTVSHAWREFREVLTHWHRRKLQAQLAKIKPDIIVCTHALPCAALALEKETGRLKTPLVAVPTDFGVHAYWISKHVDLYLAPSEDVYGELMKRGITRASIQVTGIPISRRFSKPLPQSAARKQLGLDERRPAILVSGGTKGIGPLREIVPRLLADLPDIQILVVCGENRDLYRRFNSKYPRNGEEGGRVKILPFAQNMEICLAASDILVGKAGGLTVSEALACGVPMIILDPLPGQEERNTGYVTSGNAALRVEDMEELVSAAKSLLYSRDKLATPLETSERIATPNAVHWALQRAAADLGRPDSAELACREMVQRFLLSFRPALKIHRTGV